MRGTDRRSHVLTALRTAAVGAIAGLGATGGMYLVAAIDLALSGLPSGSWSSPTEVGFGGNAGAVLGLSGPTLHVVHGVVLGALVGIAMAAAGAGRAGRSGALATGILVGLALWTAVLGLSPATRSVQGAGPPAVLSLAMHLAFGLVVSMSAEWELERTRHRGALERGPGDGIP